MNRAAKRGAAGAGALCLGVVMLLAALPVKSATIEELENMLEERDRVIIELLERVETLERRAGIVRSGEQRQPSSSDAEQFPAPTIERPVEGDAPGAVVVDETEAERALERSLVNQGALLLPQGFVELEPGMSYSREEDSTPYLLGDGNRLFVGERQRSSDTLTADLALRLGLPYDSQLELGLPYRWREVERTSSIDFAPVGSSSDSGSGLGDFRLGIAKTLLREETGWPDLIGRITWDTDSGETADGGVSLGGGFNELRGSLTAIKRQDPLVFVGGVGYEYSFEENDIDPGSTISANFGTFVALSPETSMRFFLSAAYQDDSEVAGIELDGSDRTFASLTIGGSTLLAPGTLLNVSAGVGLTEDADDFTFTVSLPFRFDGPLY